MYKPSDIVRIVKKRIDWVLFRRIKRMLLVKKSVDYNLVRIGGDSDGAYIMLDDLDGGCAFSFGVGSKIEWDKDMIERGFIVHAYDHTIESLPEEVEGLDWKKYGVAGKDDVDNSMLSINSIIERDNLDNHNNILKMDIEGAEWDALLTMSEEYLSCFSQISMEMHCLCSNYNDLIKKYKVIRKLHSRFTSVWVHANNNGTLVKCGTVEIPDLLEITMVNNSKYRLIDTEFNSPISLDKKNVDKPEIHLLNWGSVSK